MEKVGKELIDYLKSQPPKVPIDQRTKAEILQEHRQQTVDAEIGLRYSRCRFSNFDTDGEGDGAKRKVAALDAVKEFAESYRPIEKPGLFLFGPTGTGKDHLVAAAARYVAITHGEKVRRINGLDLYGDARDLIGRDETERSFVESLARPDILIISDPVPAKGEVSTYGLGMLRRIIDERYTQLKSTWVTINVLNRERADIELTPPIVRRLIEGSLVIHCNWPSYSKPAKKVL